MLVKKKTDQNIFKIKLSDFRIRGKPCEDESYKLKYK